MSEHSQFGQVRETLDQTFRHAFREISDTGIACMVLKRKYGDGLDRGVLMRGDPAFRQRLKLAGDDLTMKITGGLFGFDRRSSERTASQHSRNYQQRLRTTAGESVEPHQFPVGLLVRGFDGRQFIELCDCPREFSIRFVDETRLQKEIAVQRAELVAFSGTPIASQSQ